MSRHLTQSRDNLRAAIARLPHVPRALALVWTAARSWTVAWLGLILVQGLLPVATVCLVKSLKNSLLVLRGNAGAGIRNPHLSRAIQGVQ